MIDSIDFIPLADLISLKSSDGKPDPVRKKIAALVEKMGKGEADFDFLSDVGLKDYKMSDGDGNFILSGTAVLLASLALDFGDGAYLQFFPPDQALTTTFSTVDFQLKTPLATPSGQEDQMPAFGLQFQKPAVRIALPNKAFLLAERTPAKPKEGEMVVYKISDKQKNVVVDLAIESLGFDSDKGFDFGAGAYLQLPHPMAIGRSGFFLDHFKIGLKYEKEKFSFEVPSAHLILPSAFRMLPQSLQLQEASISQEKGFSGKVRTTWKEGLGVQLFGFDLSLHFIHAEFLQNQLSACTIKGRLGLPFFDDPKKPKTPIDLSIGIDAVGGISISAAAPVPKDKKALVPAIASLDLEYVRLEITSLDLRSTGTEGDEAKGEIVLNGRFVLDAKGQKPLRIAIQQLKIGSDGSLHFPGGWFDLKDKLSYSHLGVKIGISRVGLGFGQGANAENFIGLDGAVQLAGSLPAKAAVEGFQYFWDQKGNNGFRLKGVSLDFTIPKAIRFKGQLTFFDQDNAPKLGGDDLEGVSGMEGSVALQILPLEFGVSAQLLIAKQQQSNGRFKRFWFVYVDMNLPTGIMVGPNIAFYGLSGLIAENMQPAKKADEHWYRDWYREAPMGAMDRSKWTLVDQGFAFGLGASLGTFTDGGYLFHANAFFLLSLPGPIVMLSGKANFLKSRKSSQGNTAEGIFQFLLMYDGLEEAFLFNIELNYNQQKLLEVRGLMEVFLHLKDASKWYFHLGQKPKPKRIQAKLLDFLEANAYLMIDPKEMAFGFFIGYDKKWNFGPVGIRLACYLQGGLRAVWSPEFLDAFLEVKGEVALRIFWFEIGLLLQAKAQLQTPKPYLLDILARIKLTLPFPLPSPEIKVHLQWKEVAPPPFTDPFLALQLDQNEALQNSLTWESLSEENFSDDYEEVPMDAVINLVFEKSIGLSNKPKTAFGLPAAQPHRMRVGKEGVDFFFEYSLEELVIYKKQLDAQSQQVAWVDDNKAFEGLASFALETPSSESQGTQRVVLQIGSTDPARVFRHSDVKKLPPSQLRRIQDHLCPTDDLIQQFCWTPAPSSEPELILGALETEDFSFHGAGRMQRGGSLCDGESLDPIASPYGPCLLSYQGNELLLTFKTVVNDVALTVDSKLPFELYYKTEEGQTIRIEPQQQFDTQYIYELAEFEDSDPAVIRELILKGTCFCIQKLCYGQWEAQRRQIWATETRNFWQRQIEQWNKGHVVLEADTVYKVALKIKGKRWNGKTPTQIETQEFLQTRYFKTGGAPTDVRPYLEDLPFEFLHFRNDLIDLHPKAGCTYLQKLFEKAKPADYGEGAVLQMHFSSDSARAEIKDVQSARGQYTKWTRTQEIVKKSTSCYTGAFDKVEKNRKSNHWTFGEVEQSFTFKPQRRYEARLKAYGQANSIYDFSFRTSAYLNFEALIRQRVNQFVWNLSRKVHLATGAVQDVEPQGDRRDQLDALLQSGHRIESVGYDLFNHSLDRLEEDRSFRQIASILQFPKSNRSTGTEVFSLFGRATFYGLLLHFEEPINWHRVLLTASGQWVELAEGRRSNHHPLPADVVAFRSKDNCKLFLHWNREQLPPLESEDQSFQLELSLQFQFTRNFVQAFNLGNDNEKMLDFYRKYPSLHPLRSTQTTDASDRFSLQLIVNDTSSRS
ncbi:MAG: hypothetical protein AAF990_02290 [Bacteroidota bacterium]